MGRRRPSSALPSVDRPVAQKPSYCFSCRIARVPNPLPAVDYALAEVFKHAVHWFCFAGLRGLRTVVRAPVSLVTSGTRLVGGCCLFRCLAALRCVVSSCGDTR